jgi:hypothetical protein
MEELSIIHSKNEVKDIIDNFFTKSPKLVDENK